MSPAGAPGGTRGARPPARVDRPRRLAWEVLRAVDERGAYANLLLPNLLANSGLSVRDRGFVTELAYGALRSQGTLDGVLDTATNRPVAEIDPPVRDALRLGAYQLLRTRVPARAAVDSTVDLVRATSGERPVRFANAVLRRVAARIAETGGDLAALLGAPPFTADPIGHLAVVTAHPRWIVQAVVEALGDDVDEARAALAADDDRPAVHVVARPGRLDRASLLAEAEQAGLTARPGPYSPYAVRLDGGDPARLPSVVSGAAAVQDEGSQLVALALADTATVGPDRGLTVDLCAGPGGKAAMLAGLLAGPGATGSLLAIEPRAARANLVARSLRGAPRAWVARGDGRAAPLAPGGAARGLVDAPCTGLGALRRRPEARWRRTPGDLAALVPLQSALLVAALDLVRPGGVVAYATCSPHPAETTEVVRRVAGQRPDVSVLDATRALPTVDGLGAGPFAQLWPHRHGTDAMFLALLRRCAD
ncbi:transcription antitermination factor NusB [Frankia sp. AgB32]|uniref:RsmB/NOP family class I SAM-dependent RNA methyltransferase n=1 Tax=Frankia sp. AgB32 TaxID=631119 RepID=UPI00200D24C7|nr:transcription antitermination factor NusB [Frankia sp. AgB32]MCK9896480.1 rRNA cytosine-C5-methyltransferase [Frankia sp. AgB32]